jgi:DNA-binding transcriptional LysR family regulator
MEAIMDRFEAMRTLIAAVDGGSLSAASRALGVPLPTISRRVSDLETHLGSQLVVRTSRKLLLTEAGAAYIASARRVLEELIEAERAASGEYRAPRGELLVTAPIMFGKLHVAPIIHEFLSAYPEVNVRLILTDAVIDLVELRIDVAVRIGQLPDSGLIARRVGEVRLVTCTSPGYLERRGAPMTPAEIANHDCIAFEGLEPDREWPFSDSKGTQHYIVRPRYSVNTADAVIAAAIAGVGIICLKSYQVAASMRDGTLLPILSEWAPPPIPVQITYAFRHQKPLKLQAFLDFVAPRLQDRLRVVAEQFGPAESSQPH